MAVFGLLGFFGFQTVKIVDPVSLYEINEENDGTQGPGQGIGPGNGGQMLDKPDCYGDVADTDEAPADHHGNHGHRGLAGTAHNGGHTVGECQQEVEQADGPGMHASVGDHLGGVIEECNELGCEEIGCNTDQLCQNAGAGNTESDTFFHPVVLVSAQILAHKGGQGHGKAGDGQKCETLNFGVGTAAGHGGGAEAVDIGLNHHIGNADDGILNAGGQTEPDDGFETAEIEADGPDIQTVGFLDPHQMDEAENHADTLGKGGGQSGRAYTQLQNCHKQQIQNDVDEGGEDQIIQRMAAVTHGVKNAHEDIVHDREDGTAEIVAEIDDRLGKHVLGGAHPLQNGGGKGDTQNGQKDTCGKAEGHIRVDGDAHILMVLSAEEFCDDHTGTHGNTVEETHKHVDQASGGTDGGQGSFTDKFADGPGVKGVIKLLKDIADQNGEREQKNFFPNGALCQSIAVAVQEKHFLLDKTLLTQLLYFTGWKMSRVGSAQYFLPCGHNKPGVMKMTEREYEKLVEELSPKSPLWRDCLNAFWIGGLICTVGQYFINWYGNLGLDRENAGTAASMTLVAISAVLTGLSLYDNIAKHAGAGTLVPITGFANSVAAPAVEFKTEGFILGVGAKMFTIAGPVIVYGVSASVVYGLIYWIIQTI